MGLPISMFENILLAAGCFLFGWEFRVQAVDPQGQPVIGVELGMLRCSDDSPAARYFGVGDEYSEIVVTGSDGMAVLSPLYYPHVLLGPCYSERHRGFAPYAIRFELKEMITSTIQVTVHEGLFIAGNVSGCADIKPADVALFARPQSGGPGVWGEMAVDGGFVIGPVANVAHTVMPSYVGEEHCTFKQSVTCTPASSDCLLEMIWGTHLSAMVLSPAGVPEYGVVVVIGTEREGMHYAGEALVGPFFSRVTDLAIPAGSYVIYAFSVSGGACIRRVDIEEASASSPLVLQTQEHSTMYLANHLSSAIGFCLSWQGLEIWCCALEQNEVLPVYLPAGACRVEIYDGWTGGRYMALTCEASGGGIVTVDIGE